METINERISVLKASESPLSADVIMIRTETCTWFYDVGSNEEAYELILHTEGKKNVVLSHFHPDHCENMKRLVFDEVYVGAYTSLYFSGTSVTEVTPVDDVKIIPLPSSHAKGCLGLLCDAHLFVGDALYATQKKGQVCYNAQKLKELIGILEETDCEYICRSHQDQFVEKKEDVISSLKDIYERREKNTPYINI